MTDRTKTICPPIIDFGGIKINSTQDLKKLFASFLITVDESVFSRKLKEEVII